MNFTIYQIQEPCERFSPYKYYLLREDRKVAIFTHNYRGECETIEIISTGEVIEPPFSKSSDFIIGGGAFPHGLTKAAQTYLSEIIHD